MIYSIWSALALFVYVIIFMERDYPLEKVRNIGTPKESRASYGAGSGDFDFIK